MNDKIIRNEIKVIWIGIILIVLFITIPLCILAMNYGNRISKLEAAQASQHPNVSRIVNGNFTFRAIREDEVLAIKMNPYIFVNCTGLADDLYGKTSYKDFGVPLGVLETCAQLEVGIADVNSYRYQEAFEKYHICYIVNEKAIGACKK